jgi:squalene synthase HpnC
MTALVQAAPAEAAVLAKSRQENFPVASRLFPREVRSHLLAVYGFARLADDIGDEWPGDRTEGLAWLSSELDRVYGAGSPAHPLMRQLATTVRTFGLPREPFDRLIEANRRDQTIHRYRTLEQLLEYCELSANPVGELVLRLLHAWTPGRRELSNATCTGLQLVEFWQDLGEDASHGRVYLPLEDMERFGYSVGDLMAGRTGERFSALMRFEAERTRELLERGRALASSLPGRSGLAVRLFAAGGLAALDDLEQKDFDTFAVSGRASTVRRGVAAVRELARR